MKGAVRLRVWGEYACFTSAIKADRVSYRIITPSAAVGMLEAVYWHPGVHWVINRIYIVNPGRYLSFCTTEVKSMANGTNYNPERCQHSGMILADVEYVIEASVNCDEPANVGKSLRIFRRNSKRGRCAWQPYFGLRQYMAHFDFVPMESQISTSPTMQGTHNLGIMFWGWDYANKRGDHVNPLYFNATVVDGVIDVPLRNDLEM